MRFRPVLAFFALFLGSAWGAVHGCSVAPTSSGDAQADTGSGGAAGGTGSSSCPNVTCEYPGPALLTSYADLLATLKTGARVRVVLDYAKCTLNGAAGPNALGAMNMDTFEWFGPKVLGNPKAFLAASETHLIRLPSGFVHDYVRVRVAEDDKVTIDVQYIDPKTFEVTVDETIGCGISDATNARGATFYKLGQ
jgi:hypothetical protein